MPPNLLEKMQDKSMPQLLPLTYAVLDCLWVDDYESFALVNPLDDPQSYELVIKLNAKITTIPLHIYARLALLPPDDLFAHDTTNPEVLSATSLIEPYLRAELTSITDELFTLWNEDT